MNINPALIASSPRRIFSRQVKQFLLIGIAMSAVVLLIASTLPHVKAWAFATELRTPSERIELSRWSEETSVRLAGERIPEINLSNGRAILASYVGDENLRRMFKRNEARPLALASADFDEDGVPDLVGGYDMGGGGAIALYRGNVDAIYPNSPEAQKRKGENAFTDTPFLSPARLSAVVDKPDFIGAGDFDGDSHWDVVVAMRGANVLNWFPGDGRGNFGATREVMLPGAVTTLTVGEINRADGLIDVVVGVEVAGGAQALIFEGATGALKATPEIIPLPAAASSLALGQLDDEYAMDLAIAAGQDLVVVQGRDRKLSLDAEAQSTVKKMSLARRTFPARIKSLAVGTFSGGEQNDIALLTADGSLQVLSRRTEARRSLKTIRSLTTWRSEAVSSARWAGATGLTQARVSSVPGDDLLVLDDSNRQVHVVEANTSTAEGKTGIGAEPAASLRAPASMETTQGQPIAVLPMRLNESALDSMVFLQETQSAPIVVQPKAEMTFVVTNTGDLTRTVTVRPGQTTLVTYTTVPGSLRDAIQKANSNPGVDKIAFSIGSGPQTIQVARAGMDEVGVDRSQFPLPALTEAAIIDGTTQPGFTGTPLIRIDGFDLRFNNRNAGSLLLLGGGSNVKSLILRGAPDVQLVIGGGNVIEGNYIGILPDGSGSISDGTGIAAGSQNIIGGTTPNARNVISMGRDNSPSSSSSTRFDTFGIIIRGNENRVVGNFIGLDGSGSERVAATSQIELYDVMNNVIGGTEAGTRNIISAGQNYTIFLVGISRMTSGNLVQGNFIGLDVNGTRALGSCKFNDCANRTSAISFEFFSSGLGARSNTIGGTTAAARNVIAGFNSTGSFAAIESFGNKSSDNLIQGNYIGLNGDGSRALPNRDGIYIQASPRTVIGGSIPEARNIISGNTRHGIIFGNNFDQSLGGVGFTVQGNYIGTDPTGTIARRNGQDGIFVGAVTADDTIDSNIIAFNGANGVNIPDNVSPAVRINITNNFIFANTGLGINLGDAGITPNDTRDEDVGANFLQNFPTLTSASSPAFDGAEVANAGDGSAKPLGSITVRGSLNSTPNTVHTIHWYFSSSAQCSANQQMTPQLAVGRVANVQTDANGNAPFNFPFAFPVGVQSGTINCTATDPDGSTSEFSACLPVNDAPPPLSLSIADVSVMEGNRGTTNAAFTLTLSAASTQTVTVGFATANSTATANDDYMPNSGTVSFAPGQTSRTMTVVVLGDTTFEPNETFHLNLTTPTNATISRSQATGTIANDDAKRRGTGLGRRARLR